MWLSRVIWLAVVAALLGGCGFRPLYGQRGAESAPRELAAIRIASIADRLGQQVHNQLLDLLNPRGQPGNPKYLLRVTLKESVERLAVQRNSFATRANLRLNALVTLVEAEGDGVLYSTNTLVVSSYNILSDEFATLMAEKDARARAAREISHNIQTRLGAFFAGGGPARVRARARARAAP